MIHRPFQPGLRSLVWPIEPQQFLREYWQRKPLLVRGSPRRLGQLARIYRDFDLLEILRRADLQDTRVIYRPVPEVMPKQLDDLGTLLTLYNAGVQLYIGTSSMEGVPEWIDAATRDLGTIGSQARGDLYATRKDGGVTLHFDRNDNFTIQLQGKKQWRYSENEHYDRPLHNFFTGTEQVIPYDPTYRSTVPRRVLRDLTTVVLEPGDMLYTPVGFWHATDATTRSLSFNLSILPMPWSDVLIRALQTSLDQLPAWRATAMRDSAACAGRLAELAELVSGLRPDDLAQTSYTSGTPDSAPDSAPDSEPDSEPDGDIDEATFLRRNPLVWWHCPCSEDRDSARIELVFPDQTARQLQVPRIFLSLLDRLPKHGRPFRASSVLSRWRHDRGDGLEFLHALVVTGMLSIHTAHTASG